MAPELSRRQFITLLGASGLGILAGCTPGEETTTTAGRATTTLVPTTDAPIPGDVWSFWEEVRRAVRGSPDHLAEHAASLVEGGQMDAILRFVADELSTYPPRADGFESAVTATRWGIRGVLRCGAGTPREKAELLASMLSDAGHEAEVVMGRASVTDGRGLLRRGTAPGFAPDIESATLDRWLEQMGAAPAQINDPDPDGEVSGRLADTLLALLPTVEAEPVFNPMLDLMPMVRVTEGGSTLILDPSTPSAPAVDGSEMPVSVPPPATSLPVVEVELAVSSSSDPGSLTTVAAGSWPLDRLIGRRLVARFLPAGDLAAALTVPAIQITSFTPVLTVDGPDLSIDEAAADGVLGDLVTVTGSVITEDDSGVVAVDGAPVGVAADPVASDIASMEVTANVSAFPFVRLQVAATDVEGASVLGASGDAFGVSENGAPVPFLVRQATPPPPRILLLFDGSESIPAEFRHGGAVEFGTSLATSLFSRFPDALIRVAGVNYGLASASPSWMSDVSEVSAELNRIIAEGSELWSAMADARGLGANVIALITDGDATDPEEGLATLKSQVAVGPPVIAVGVGAVDAGGLGEVARVSAGAALPGGTPEEATAAIIGYLGDRDLTPIHIEYQARPGDPVTRTVTVRTANTETSVDYSVPPETERATPPSLSGLYLVVRMNGREVVRTLAGLPVEDASSSSSVPAHVSEEVRAALFGVAMLSVEAGAPTTAAWFDDIFSARLSLRPLVDADPSPEGVVAALSNAVHHIPSELITLHAPMEGGADSLTFETGPRMVLLVRRPLFGGGAIRRADILPFTGFASADPNPASAFVNTMRATARLSVAEAAVYTDSTLSRLEGRSLEVLLPAAPAAREGPVAPFARLLDRWAANYRLIPADGQPFAFWSLGGAGTMLGVLPDGSGGGSSSDANAQCTAMNQAFSALDLLGWAGGMPFAFGAFLALGKAIAKQALREAAIIASLGGEMPDTSQCGNGPTDVPCDLAKDLASDALGLEGVSVAEKVYGVATGGDLINC